MKKLRKKAAIYIRKITTKEERAENKIKRNSLKTEGADGFTCIRIMELQDIHGLKAGYRLDELLATMIKAYAMKMFGENKDSLHVIGQLKAERLLICDKTVYNYEKEYKKLNLVIKPVL